MNDDVSERIATIERQIVELNQQVAGLSGPHLNLVAGAVDTAGAVVEEPHAEIIMASGPPPGESVAEWVGGVTGTPGIVVDPGLARTTPCLRVELSEGQALVFSRGVIGALDADQEALYCGEGYETIQPSDEQRARLSALRSAAQVCRTEVSGEGTEQHLTTYFSCLGRELRDKGVEL